MARGTLTLFTKFRERLGDAQINLSSAVLMAVLTSDTTAAPPGGGETATDPRYGAGGTENLSTTECAAGGGYALGGNAIDGADPWGVSGANAAYTAQNPVWLSAFSGDPTNVRYAVIYIDDGVNYYGVGYVQLYDGVTDVDMTTGDVIVKWNGGASSGTVFTI